MKAIDDLDLTVPTSPRHPRPRRALRSACLVAIICLFSACGDGVEVFLERARTTTTPCDDGVGASRLTRSELEQVSGVLLRRCEEQRCEALRDALASAQLESIRSLTVHEISEANCPVAPQVTTALSAVDSIQAATDAVPPRWGDAWVALQSLPAVRGSSRSTFVSDDLVQRIAGRCYAEAARVSEEAASQANWVEVANGARRAQECGSAQTEDGPTPEQLAELGERIENAELCGRVDRATAASSWANAIAALQTIGDATAASRLSQTELAAIARALRTGRSHLERERRASERAERRCDYANRRAERCVEICARRDRGDGRCFDMCERRYPGCRDSGEASTSGEPVVRSLHVRICDSPGGVAAGARAQDQGRRPESAPRRSRRGRQREAWEAGTDDFE